MRRRSKCLVLLASVSIGIGTAAAIPATADETSIGGYGALSTANLRQNWDNDEQTLGSNDVVKPDFGKLWSHTIAGTTTKTPNQQYAQPLVYGGKVYVATEENQVEILDEKTGATVASRNLGTPWTPVDCGDLTPHIGITSTPVLDPTTKTMYVITKTQVPGKTTAYMKMWGLSTTTLATKPGWPLDIQGVPSNSTLSFNPTTANARPSLMEDGKGAIYFATASHCDHGPYVGYVGRVATSSTGSPGSSKALSLWSAESQTALDEAGIWQSGGSLMSDGNDSNGNPRLFLATGNGVSPAPGPGNKPPGTLGEAVVRLAVNTDGTMTAKDYFSPANNADLNGDDADLGSGAPVALPDSFGTTTHPHLTTVAGKDGTIYLLDRDNLGGTAQGAQGTDNALDEETAGGGVWGHAGVFDGGTPTTRLVYYAASHQPMKAYLVTNTDGTPHLTQVGSTSESYAYGASSPVVTSYQGDASSALVWLTVADGGNSGTDGYLEAFPAVPPTSGPWKALVKYSIGTQNKFTQPATSDDKVFVGTKDGHVLAFGEPTTGAVTAPPTDFGQQAVGSNATTHNVTLTATKEVTVKSVSVSGAAFARGAGQPTLPTKLEQGATLQIPIAFKPTVAGTNNGTLTVDTTPTDTGTDTKYPFSLSGIGTKDGIAANPSAIAFGQDPTNNGVSESVTIQNTGTTPATIASVTKQGSGVFQFYGTQPQVGDTIAPQSVATFTIEFDPASAVRYTGSLQVSATVNGTSYPVTVNLSGQGIHGAPKLVFSGANYSSGTINFGNVAPGTTKTTYLTVTNDGNVADKINKAATPSEPFEVPSPIDEGVTIQPGDALTVRIDAVPTTGNPHTDHYVISDANGAHYVYTRVNTVHQTGGVRGTFGCITDRDLIRINNNPVVNNACNGTASQNLSFDNKSVLHWFASYGDHCMDPHNGAKTAGTPVLYEPCNGSKGEVWTFSASGKMVNTNSGLCMAVQDSKTAPNTPLILASCASKSKGELWDPNSVIGKRGWILSGLGSIGQFCITGPKYGATNDQPTNVQACNLQTYNGQYTTAGNANPSQVIAHAGNTLRVAGGCLTQSHYAAGSAVLVESCVNSITQQWQAQSNGSVRNITTHACLNTYGGAPSGSAPTKPLTVYGCNGTAAQVFTLPDK